jgi:hypothetical protein
VGYDVEITVIDDAAQPDQVNFQGNQDPVSGEGGAPSTLQGTEQILRASTFTGLPERGA